MCAQSQHLYSRLYHALLSAYGSGWNKRYLGMFTTFMDDSGTAPEHKVAIAVGIVFPTQQLLRFETEWATFLAKERISDFHSSECFARNQHSPFATWDDCKVKRVFARVRQMTFKYSITGFCIAILKQDYEEVAPPDVKEAMGHSYYTWAASSVLGLAYDWATAKMVPMEYVFDNADKSVKDEIEAAIAFSERTHGDHFAGHYSFRKRKEVPALQAIDLFAWTCFQQARGARLNIPLHAIVQDSAIDYERAKNGDWRVVQSLNRAGIEKWIGDIRDDPRTKEIIVFKKARMAAKKARSSKPTKRKNPI